MILKKVSLRWRLTLLSSLLIAACCIGLSIVLSVSAYRMADAIDANVMQPAQVVGEIQAVPIEPSFDSRPAELAGNAGAEKHSYLMKSLFFTVIAVFSGGVLTYYVSGKALEPVRVLNEQAKNINAHNLNESLAVPQTKDELAELTASFNEMTDKLAQVFAMQKRFSADAAHELRTPLTILQTKLDVFRKKPQHSPEEYEALMIAFQKQINRLRGLVTELLEIANMEHELQKEDVSIQLLLHDVVNELTPVLTEKGIEIAVNGDAFEVSGDYNLLYRAFYNLIENAVKYNRTNGSVTVDMAIKEEKAAMVTVSDTGIGIPDEMKEQIFTPFCRVDKSRSREMGGAGLGLSLAESIIKKHNGTILVTDNKGGGSCFTVTLPIT